MIKQYEKYKPIKSTVYKEAPINWNKYRVKDTVDKNTYYPVGDGDHGSIKPEMYQEEGIPYIRVQNLTWHGEILTDGIVCISEDVQLANKKSILYPGDILIAKTGATIGKLGLIPESIKEANTTSSVGKLTVDKKRFSPKYILYCFQSRALQDQIWLEASQKSAQPGFNIDDLIVFEFLAPDLDSQLKVVDYLDHQTAIIDQLILQKENLIELLKERRQAVINEAVKKGLNLNAKMKDSGIEWLGEVPENWKHSKLKWISEIYAGGTPSTNVDEFWQNGTIPWLNSGSVNQKRINMASEFITEEAVLKSSTKWVPKGAILMALAGQGKTKGTVAILEIDATCNQSMAAIVPDPIVKNEYLYYWLHVNYERIRGLAGSEQRDGLNLQIIGDIFCPLPPISVQKEIIDYIYKIDTKTDSAVMLIEDQIVQLKKYRQSIISEAVTGKIDVRDWQPNRK